MLGTIAKSFMNITRLADLEPYQMKGIPQDEGEIDLKVRAASNWRNGFRDFPRSNVYSSRCKARFGWPSRSVESKKNSALPTSLPLEGTNVSQFGLNPISLELQGPAIDG
ncbi:hypothetical protein KM043_010347 [Ampulex compressa]|nr:hypothetical protein KM043_010347 [Ampulex compressa]